METEQTCVLGENKFDFVELSNKMISENWRIVPGALVMTDYYVIGFFERPVVKKTQLNG